MKALPIIALCALVLTGCESHDSDDATDNSTGGVKAHFLRGWGGESCSLVWLSPKVSVTKVNIYAAQHAAAGYNTAFCYLYNDGDMGGKFPVAAHEDLETNAAKLAAIKAAGLDVWFILTPDDSPGITGRGPAGMLALFDKCAPLHTYASAIVTGIELRESWSKAQVDALGSGLSAKGWLVAHHTLPMASGGSYGACASSWCSYALIQTGYPFKRMELTKAQSIINDAKTALTASVLAFEYDVELDGSLLGGEAGWACGRGI